ncbi:MAG: cell surface protein SprA [Bacteroidia bacterium]|nr:cell surface protein SprA [Bacteroidia bacterium]
MKKTALYNLSFIILLILSGIQASFAQQDTTKTRFPVQKTTVETTEDLNKKSPIDLKTPSNIRTEVVYDYKTNRYIFQNKIGDTVIGIPFTMSPAEYMEYTQKKLNNSYFKARNAIREETESEPKASSFSLFNIRKSNNLLEDIFGPGGVQITTQGSVELSMGIKRNVTNNPTLPERARSRNTFDVKPQIQLNVNAKVGNKINFGMNYNNDAMFDFDAKRIKLAYQGDEDEIIKNIEAGNVSMTTGNSLINGGAALFGIKSDLQFGKLRVNTILSQQESESKTVNSRGGVQTTPFEITADQYDENRHFFLSYYFRDNYNQALSKLPYIQSAVLITRVEVWITNKRSNYDLARNILAFADLAEHSTIHNPLWQPSGSESVPYNEANTLYQQLISTYATARDISQSANTFPTNVIIGRDYEKIENARLLSSSEYTFQPQLGYISLQAPLQADEVLAVAFEYTYNGKVYQVGEFSNDVTAKTNQSGALFLKLLKPVSLSPQAYTWHLMMKNIYALGYGAHNIQRDRFKLNITYQSDTTGVYLNYIPDGDIRNELLLKVMNLDNLNSKNDPYPDGIFDFIDGYTVMTQNGRIIFPVVEPFGSHLRKKIGNDAIADKYVFQQLYDSTLTVARQIAEKNKFRISGEYRGSSGSDINLNAMNVARGSVRVTAGGVTLTEGTDYTVDYISGTVSIINQAILDARTPVNVSLENQSLFNMQRKTLMGLNLAYDFSKNFTLGATIMHYYEKPLTTKTAFGDESVKNTLWGLNTSFKKESYALTNLLDMLPFVEATAPSQLSANLEFAHMIPGHYKNKYTGGYSYLDDFETSTSGIDLRSPYNWSLASTPLNNTSSGLFPEAALSNNIDYGKNRAQLAWFYIDGLFTRRNSSLTPAHIKNDKEQLSDHLVREVYEREIYPNKEAMHGEPPTIPTLNLSFYPDERGPYNLDTNIDSDGKLLNPRNRWGGITRRMDTRNFEAANIEYLEFWLMDPFVNDTLGTSRGGDLYFNLGEISEDVLKDGKKFFENGLPVNGDESAVGFSVWGKYPLRQSTVYAFDNSLGNESRRIQDVGLNGLSTQEEKAFPTYSTFLNNFSAKLSPDALSRMQADNHSPLNDPSGDNFRHYRGDEQDRAELSILNRYKYYNGTEGNSLAPEEAQRYSTASRTTPDVEDIDNDNTLNENESYYQYKVQLRPENMKVGTNHIVDKREVAVSLRNGKTGKVNWYQFKIPIRDFESRIGNIQGFNNIRFMRMFLAGFEKPIFLRFATLELVRSEWRSYMQSLQSGGAVSGLGKLEISTVNIEENSDRTPVNYVLPPGVTRILDPAQPQLRQQNEQAITMKISNLDPGDSRSIYKNTMYDLRRYKRLQMFVHAEELATNATNLQDGQMSIFLRIGSDYRNNYYEYEIPLQLTPAGRYSTRIPADQEAVWKPENMFDFPLKNLTELKLKRNAEKRRQSSITYLTPYSQPDPEKSGNRMTIVGNPSLAEAKILMIGVRNNANSNKSAEVWINELRLSEFDEKGGWAVQGNVQLALSDIGTVNFSGRKETAGFGAIDQSLLQRRNDDYSSVDVSLNMDLGRFLPAQAKILAPFYYSYSNQTTAPKYDPLDQDILLSESLKNTQSNQEKDSINNLAVTQTTTKSLSLNNVKVDIKSENPMPYDPTNFSFSYSYNQNHYRNPETEYNNNINQRLQVSYTYTPFIKPFEPFKNIESNSGWLKLIKSINLNYLPNNIRLNSNMVRNYQEAQLRDLNAYMSGQTQSQKQLLTFSQNFAWNRDFSITWDLTRNLKMSFRSGTIAEIEEPYLQVNKKLNRDDYEIWKDSVIQSIKNLGKPLNYEQNADVTYTLPFAQIPILDWINSSAAYNSRYRWERGAFIRDENIGNFLQNDMSLTMNARLNLVQLYNKIGFLQKINQRFDATGLSDSTRSNFFTDIVQYTARGLMMLRNVNINFGYKSRSDIPGFSPMIGDFFGQSNTSAGLIPGLAFAFGFDGGEHFLERADANNWLIKNQNNISPAIYNQTKNLRVDATIEPFKGLKIDLNALYEDNRRTEIRYMFDGKPKLYGGSFAITTVALASAFENSTAHNNYVSASFNRFLENRGIIVERMREKYQNSTYPNRGFIADTPFHDQSFNTANGDVDPNSADVLIPAFLAAYTGQNADKIGLTAFPNLLALLPNWDISYNLLQMLPILRSNFRSIILTHKYVSQYRVGSFSSFLNWVPMSENSDLGYIRDILSGAPIPSSPYSISAVNLIESFSPLIEARGVLTNNMTVNFRINRTRSLNLNIPSFQIVETNDNDIVFGLGYRWPDFNRIIGFGSNSMKSDRRRSRTARIIQTEQSNTNLSEFNNDLNIRIDISHKNTQALIRKIEDNFTQATSGLKTTTIRFSADYDLSRSLTLRAFFDKIINTPLVSSSAYSTSNTSAGMSLRFNLNQ